MVANNKGPGPILFNDYWWKKFERADVASDFFVTVMDGGYGHQWQTMPGEVDRRKPLPLATRKQAVEWGEYAHAHNRRNRNPYRIRVIKRDPSTYLDRLLHAAENLCMRTYLAWQDDPSTAKERAYSDACAWHASIVHRHYVSPPLAKPAVITDGTIEFNAKLQYERSTANNPVVHANREPSWHELSAEQKKPWVDSVADAMLKGIAP